MKIKKIVVDEKPEYCGDCRFCCQYYDDEYEEYVYRCVVTDKPIDDCDAKNCDIFEEQNNE